MVVAVCSATCPGLSQLLTQVICNAPQIWWHSRHPDPVSRYPLGRLRRPTTHFPYFGMAVLLPCAISAALGFRVTLTASVLMLDEIKVWRIKALIS
jgi:hypothetical protein